jgi:hypothetical protein
MYICMEKYIVGDIAGAPFGDIVYTAAASELRVRSPIPRHDIHSAVHMNIHANIYNENVSENSLTRTLERDGR